MYNISFKYYGFRAFYLFDNNIGINVPLVLFVGQNG